MSSDKLCTFYFFSDNVSTKNEAFGRAKTLFEYYFLIPFTLRQQFKNAKLFSNVSYIVDCIKIGNKLVFTDSYRKMMSCNSDGTNVHHISMPHKPGYITEIDSDTVAVSCIDRTILIIKLSTTGVISTIKTSKFCRAISYNDNNLYAVVDNNSIHMMDMTGNNIRIIPLPSVYIVDMTVDRDTIVYIDETSIYCCSTYGKLIWKFEIGIDASLNCVTTDDENNVYVADLNSTSVFVVSGNGNRCRTLFGKSNWLNRTGGIYFDRKEKILLVCNNEDEKAFLFDINTELI